MSFHRSVRQSSVRRLLSLLLALLATPAQDLNSAGPSIFPHTGLTSAYPGHYAAYAYGPLLLEPSLPPGHTAWPPAPIAERAVGGLLRPVYPILRDRRPALYAAPLVSSEYHVLRYTTWPNGDVSLLGLRVTAVSQVLTHDAYVPSSKILTLATFSRRHRLRLAVYPLSALALRRLIASPPP